MTAFLQEHGEIVALLVAILWTAFGTTVVIGGRLAYVHIMAAFESAKHRDDALGKRVTSYEHSNNEKHGEILERLSHVEALVNGKKPRLKRRAN